MWSLYNLYELIVAAGDKSAFPLFVKVKPNGQNVRNDSKLVKVRNDYKLQLLMWRNWIAHRSSKPGIAGSSPVMSTSPESQEPCRGLGA